MNRSTLNAIQKRVRRKYPGATLEQSTGGVMYQKWFLWRDRSGREFTGDLIGCGMTKAEAWRDAAARLA